jgi:hypothetical protein
MNIWKAEWATFGATVMKTAINVRQKDDLL